MVTTRLKRILLVDDDREVHAGTKHALRGRYDLLSAYDGDEAKAVLRSQSVDAVLLDLSLRAQNDGLELLPKLREFDADATVIIMSGNTEIGVANQAIAAGAAAYLVKDCSVDQLVITVESVLRRRELERERDHHARDCRRALEKHRILGESPAVKQLLRDLEKIRRSPANVLISAETGCGKELVARHIGTADGRPFVAVDSATITSSMAESILFGHEKGAFTGALASTRGLFEEADGGTIYFDEIANMPLDIQAKLLRVLQEKEIKRVGSTKVLPLEFRVICATNRDLEKLVAEGRFLGDFLQRLNVLELRIPPLREHADDLDQLVPHFFALHKMDGSASGVSADALAALKRYAWPGNVRELSNVVANLCAMVSDQEVVEAEDLPPKIREAAFREARQSAAASAAVASATAGRFHELEKIVNETGVDFYSYMDGVEREVLAELYRVYGGNVPLMSKQLRVGRSHLYTKLKIHRIHA
ncbi:MAG: sigma-54-dependent Fis family transcriptional regulator [Deltaproteobacteria bacterium]|nr:sigma-54-dependent Fis family transcriptional regulator [Deltaproteobacteria bacterium]